MGRPDATAWLDPGARERASSLELALLAAAILAAAAALPWWSLGFRPEYAHYDEQATLDQIQAWREGGPLMVRFARSSLHRLLVAGLVELGGPRLCWLRLPALVAVPAEAALLALWLRDKVGPRAALWAALANLVCAATLARGVSLLGASLLPCLFLLHALAVDRIRRPGAAAAWGLTAALCLLDYEGWLGALLFLLPYAGWTWRADLRRALAAAAGGAAGLALVLIQSPDLLAHFRDRGAASAPGAGTGVLTQVASNLGDLLSSHDRLAFSGASGHPWPGPWMWPLAALGVAAAWRRSPWLLGLLAAGAAPLALAHTAQEPHRLSLALLAAGACAGCGAALLWRTRWGAALCLALLAVGAVDEVHAWVHQPPDQLLRTYGPARNRLWAAQWLREHSPAGGWDVITGLGQDADGDLRFLLDAQGVGGRGRVPVAVVPWDDRSGLHGMRAAAPSVAVGRYQTLILFFPAPGAAARLRAVSASLRDLHLAQVGQSPGATALLAAAWLDDPSHADPWARTAAWEVWGQAGGILQRFPVPEVRRLAQEDLVSAWTPDFLSHALAADAPDLAARLGDQARRVDVRSRRWEAEDATGPGSLRHVP